MYIARNLRRLRLEKGLTQEDLAARIGVTGQAVSKWERDECYPDITLLPGLANCFGVSVDALLGMQEISDSKRLRDVYARMHDLGRKGQYDEIVHMMASMLRTFPDNVGLLSCLSAALALSGDRTGRAVQLCQEALAACTSYKTHGTICATLCLLHQRAGEAEKAEKLARSLPHARESRELLLPIFLSEEARKAYLQENLPGILATICALIDGGDTSDEMLRSILLGTDPTPIDPVAAAGRITAFLEGR